MYCLAIVFLVTSILLSHVNASVRLAIAIDTAAIADEVQRTHLSQPASDIPTLHHNAEGIDAESYAEMRELWNDPVANECCGANRDGYCKDNTGGTPYCGHGSCNIFGCNCDGGCRSCPPPQKTDYALMIPKVVIRTDTTTDKVVTMECCHSMRGGCCLDGTEGTPYCGHGPCNAFGCNCDGGCRS